MTDDAYKYFRVEAGELIAAIQHGIIELEKGSGATADIVVGLLRSIHTLKGAARIVRQTVVAREAHEMETVLGPYRGRSASVSAEDIGALLRAVDVISDALALLGDNSPKSSETAREGSAVEATPAHADSLRVDLAEIDALLDAIFDFDESFGRLRRVALDIESAEELARRARSAAADGPEAATLGALRSAVTNARRELAESLSVIGARVRQVREHANRLRLVPAGMIIGPLERAARDAAHELGKRVHLQVTGGENHLDEHVLTSIRDAVLHLVRNAVAHGVEPEKERLALGKPPIGRIDVFITREGSRIRFRCSDDGSGIDPEAVRRSAAQLGVPHDSHGPASLDEAMNLMFETGVSTTSQLTPLSGRGIGLDAVREAARRLKGEVEVTSEPGRGAAFSIVVPVSLSSLVGIRFRAGATTLYLPLDAVRKAVRLAIDDGARASNTGSIALDGEELPFYDLGGRTLASGAARSNGGGAGHVLLIQGKGKVVALGVDEILGVDHLVMKPAPPAIEDMPLLGISFDAEGKPIPVLDPSGLLEALRADGVHAHAEAAPPEPLSVLVVDDSLTSRMVEQSILESAGYRVDLASSGEEGLEKTRQRRYGLFLVDVDMPGISGFEFIARLRADPIHRDVPSIIVSSRSSTEDRRRGADVGARGYLVKSQYAREDLLGMISKLVS